MSRLIGSASALELRRQQAVRAVHAGDKVADVARLRGVGKNSIYRWLQQAKVPDGLKAKPHPGSALRLSFQQQHELETLLRQGAKAHGWPNDLWTTQRIADVIERHFGIHFHHAHGSRLLRQKMGWSPQKPKRRARERNEEAIAHGQAVTFPALLDAVMARNAHVVFLDESGFMRTPTVRRTWAPQGPTPVLSSWDRRDRISAIRCIMLSPQRARLNFSFELLPDNINATAEHIVAFLRHLKAQLGAFTVIWDGSNIHSRAGVEGVSGAASGDRGGNAAGLCSGVESG